MNPETNLNMNHNPIAEYFNTLARNSYDHLNNLPISLQPEPLEAIMNRLKPALDHRSDSAITALKQFLRPEHTYMPSTSGVGLNTIGMLADRMTILVIREWSIRNKRNDHDAARLVYENQTKDITLAMANTAPGTSAINDKLTRLVSGARAQTWEEAYWGLFSTNLLLWESQEILYIKDIALLPSEELRSYIKWFAEGNIERNQFIQLCEHNYWQA
jgi:hypothetical protein